MLKQSGLCANFTRLNFYIPGVFTEFYLIV